MGQEWATPENDYYAGESQLHIGNTRERGTSIDFWMFNPHRTDGVRSKIAPIRCGQCNDVIPKGKRHCPHCWGEED